MIEHSSPIFPKISDTYFSKDLMELVSKVEKISFFEIEYCTPMYLSGTKKRFDSIEAFGKKFNYECPEQLANDYSFLMDIVKKDICLDSSTEIRFYDGSNNLESMKKNHIGKTGAFQKVERFDYFYILKNLA